jgi:hypothetical protein
MPRRFVEFTPAPVIGFDFVGERLDEPRRSDTGHELLNPLNANVVHHDLLSTLAAPEALLVSGAGEPINSQKLDQLRRNCEQNATSGWRFD